jgi:hypothetical protein
MVEVNGISVTPCFSENISGDGIVRIPEETRERLGVQVADELHIHGGLFVVRPAIISDIRKYEANGIAQNAMIFLARDLGSVFLTRPAASAGAVEEVPATAEEEVASMPYTIYNTHQMVICASPNMTARDGERNIIRIPAGARTRAGVAAGDRITLNGVSFTVHQALRGDIEIFEDRVPQNAMMFIHPSSAAPAMRVLSQNQYVGTVFQVTDVTERVKAKLSEQYPALAKYVKPIITMSDNGNIKIVLEYTMTGQAFAEGLSMTGVVDASLFALKTELQGLGRELRDARVV